MNCIATFVCINYFHQKVHTFLVKNKYWQFEQPFSHKPWWI